MNICGPISDPALDNCSSCNGACKSSCLGPEVSCDPECEDRNEAIDGDTCCNGDCHWKDCGSDDLADECISHCECNCSSGSGCRYEDNSGTYQKTEKIFYMKTRNKKKEVRGITFREKNEIQSYK